MPRTESGTLLNECKKKERETHTRRDRDRWTGDRGQGEEGEKPGPRVEKRNGKVSKEARGEGRGPHGRSGGNASAGAFPTWGVVSETLRRQECAGGARPGRPDTGEGHPSSLPFPSHSGRPRRPGSPAPSPVHRRLVVGVEGPGEGARRHLEVHGVGQHRSAWPPLPSRPATRKWPRLRFRSRVRGARLRRHRVPPAPRFHHPQVPVLPVSGAFRFPSSWVPPCPESCCPGWFPGSETSVAVLARRVISVSFRFWGNIARNREKQGIQVPIRLSASNRLVRTTTSARPCGR